MINQNTSRSNFNPFEGPEIEKIISPTKAQSEILVDCALGGDDANRAYNISYTLKLIGNLDQNALEESLHFIVNRHEALRSCFSEDGHYMTIFSTIGFSIPYTDLSENKDSTVKQLISADANHVFNLIHGPLFKFSLIKTATSTHLLLITFHHTISDGLSVDQFFKELGICYTALSQHKTPELPKPKLYSVFAEKERTTHNLGDENYWLDMYKTSIPKVELPLDFTRPSLRTYNNNVYHFKIDPIVFENLKQTGVTVGASLVVTFMSAFELFLNELTNQNHLIVGLNTSRHVYHNMIGVIGHGVNLLPISTNIDRNITFIEYLKHRKEAILDAFDHQSISFGQLLEKLPLTPDLSRIPLVPVVLNLEFNNNLQRLFSFRDLEHEVVLNHRDYATFELEIQAHMDNEGPYLNVNYNTSLFKQDSIEQMMLRFNTLLKELVNDSSIPIHQILSNHYTKAYSQLNATTATYPSKCLHELLLEQTKESLNKTALEFNDISLTYDVLHTRIQQFAYCLQQKGVQPGDLIAVSLTRSEHLVPLLIAILQCGSAYVPLDPKFPQARLDFMLEDSESKYLITDKNISSLFSNTTPKIFIEDLVDRLDSTPTAQSFSFSDPNGLAYILYTSGSTGNPKGVKVSHKNLINFLYAMAKAPGITSNDRLLSITTISFDIAGLELFLPLLNGATLVLTDDSVSGDGWQLLELIKNKSISYLQATPTTWQMLLDSDWDTPLPIKALCGGEPLPLHLAKQLAINCDELWNMYGPTETTIWSTVKKIDLNSTKITIGRPIANTRIYIISNEGNLVSPGTVGELCIAGDGVALGYLNRPELTASKFQYQHLSKNLSETVYKTGDLGKLLPNGDILCLGRADNQIKLRGHRIELGEIETALLSIPDVKQAAVVVNNSGKDTKIVAYLTSKTSSQNTDVIRHQLSLILPDILIPKIFMWIPEFPTTPNGKIDKKRLPEPIVSRSMVSQKKPQSALQKEVSKVWSEFLDIESIGLEENFFEIGGSSIIAQKVISKLRKQLNSEIPLIKLFQFPTLLKFTEYLSSETEIPQRFALKSATKNTSQDIAIIGVSCRFPGAQTLNAFWDILKHGKDTITFFNDEELSPYVDPIQLKNPQYVKARGILSDAKKFDASFFGLNPLIAKTMDPQQRLFLEICYEALEQSGYLAETKDNLIGVYAGCDNTTYHTHNLLGNKSHINQVGHYQVYINNSKDFIAPRVAYHLNLKGPAVSVHSACSTALLAVAEGVKSIRSGQCKIALAGASSISSPIKRGHLYEEGSIYSPDGHCRSFDAKGQGTIFSDGAGVVVLKSLEAAEQDGDHIYGVIKGIGLNNDGANKGSFTAPSSEGQSGAIINALNDAQVLPSTIQYVEAHGTATPIGDPIEVEGLKMAYGQQDHKAYCALGSVKSNIGHTGAAAGIAGLIKTILAFQNQQIPPMANFNSPNPNIDFKNSPFYINKSLIDWHTDGFRRAGISSFGVGGTNVHLILEDYKPTKIQTTPSKPYQILTWSAKSELSLSNYQNKLLNYVNSTTYNLADIAYSLNTTRANYKHKSFIVMDHEADFEDTNFENVVTQTTSSSIKDIGFLFPGQGAQFIKMGQSLYTHESVYQEAIDTCAQILEPYLNTDIRDILYPDSHSEPHHKTLQDTRYTQPALFVTEYALAKLWMSWGITPTFFCGHSVGEFVGAHLAGIFNLNDALYLVATRGKLMSDLETGSMLSIRLSEAKILELLPDNLSLAAVNSKHLSVVAGPTNSIHSFAEYLDSENIPNKLLITSHAFHSYMMTPMLKTFENAFSKIHLNTPNTPIVSTVTGTWLTDNEATDISYWVNHAKQTVRFADALTTIFALEDIALIETGPGKALTSLTHQHAAGTKPISIVHSLDINKSTDSSSTAYKTMLNALGELWQKGLTPNWSGFYKDEQRTKLPLPSYAFNKKEFWVEPDSLASTPTPLSFATNKVAEFSPDSSPGTSSDRFSLIRTLPTTRKEDTELKHKITQIISEVSGITYDHDITNMSFLELGLESLSLTQLASKLRNVFNPISITFRQLNEELINLKLVVSYISGHLLTNRNEISNTVTPSTDTSKLIFKASNPPSKGAKLGRDKKGNPSWFVDDPSQQGHYIKIDF